MTLDSILLAGATAAALLWATLSAYVLLLSHRRERARTSASEVIAHLEAGGAAGLQARILSVKPLLDRLSRDMVLHIAADPATPAPAVDALVAHLYSRWPSDLLVSNASRHQRPRDAWRRIAAMRVLFHAKHPATIGLLDTALRESDPSIAEAALSLLGSSDDPAAVDVMIRALKAQRHRAGLVAVCLEGSPVRPVDRLLPLLQEPDPVLRAWAARLLGEYPGVSELEEALIPLTADADPRVRKAAIAALGRIGDEAAAQVALRLLADGVPFVRAHAARALGDLERSEHAAAVATLLADGDWWVRAAAKQALEAMGPDIWTALLPCLSHPDKFVRNGAAEVIQNLGILDSLIVMEAASDSPSAAKVDLLRRIAEAGGARLAESLVERAGPITGPRVRRLLTTMGLEHVGAA